uniref:Uncharacterized protein n=1 Tax=Lepeophtheirus salmonis TaxID=72036 RepID=A0A0K2VEU1_LEPSM
MQHTIQTNNILLLYTYIILFSLSMCDILVNSLNE